MVNLTISSEVVGLLACLKVVDFQQAWYVICAYAYHFWILVMMRLRRGMGDQYLHRTSAGYRAAIRRKLCAHHVYVQLGCFAQGLLQHLAIKHNTEVWRCFRLWLLSINPAMPPSDGERIAA
jgi:hypothetical protein